MAVEESSASDAQKDALADSIADGEEMDESGEFMAKPLPIALVSRTKTALISIEYAKTKIGQDVLKVFDDQFKGALTEVRHPDDGDLFD